MAYNPKLVNKQFNSPIGLYSEQNIRDVIEREQKMLANGAVGIDFHNPAVGKPHNLQNSAVLRMLEEEEQRQRSGRAGVKRVAWPPQDEGVPDSPYIEQSAAKAQGGPQYPSQSPGLQQQNNYSQPSPYQQQTPQQQQHQQYQQPSPRPLKPLDVNSVSSASPLGSPLINQTPSGFRPATPSKRWAPVLSPVASPLPEPGRQYGVQTSSFQSTTTQQQYRSASQSAQQSGQALGQQYQILNQASSQQQQVPSQAYNQQYQTPSQQYNPPESSNPSQFFQPAAAQVKAAPRVQSSKSVEPPPSTITLRPQAPVSQLPPPVYSSQPATATLRVVVGGKNLRGDLKWPPENVKEQMEAEKQHLIELARGPACRPRKQHKDYTPFFERHALNSTYPGYKIPPGTQFYRSE